MPAGRADSRCRIGSRNAAVLPLPVMAQASTSRPASAGGMASRWMGVGRLEAQRRDGAEQVGVKSEIRKRHGAGNLLRAGNWARGQSSADDLDAPHDAEADGKRGLQMQVSGYSIHALPAETENFPRGRARITRRAGPSAPRSRPRRGPGSAGRAARWCRCAGTRARCSGRRACRCRPVTDGGGARWRRSRRRRCTVRLRGSPGHGVPFLPAIATEETSIHGLVDVIRPRDCALPSGRRRLQHAELYSTAMRALICRAWGPIDT